MNPLPTHCHCGYDHAANDPHINIPRHAFDLLLDQS